MQINDNEHSAQCNSSNLSSAQNTSKPSKKLQADSHQQQQYSSTQQRRLPKTYADLIVTKPELDMAKNHFTYLISGSDQIGQIEIRRRFNDFFYYRESLKKRYIGLYIPPIAEKMLTGNKDQGNIETRRRYFQYFMSLISQSKELFYCPVTQEFLKNKSIDMEKAQFFATCSQPTPIQQLEKYKQLFPNLPQIDQGKKAASLQQKKVIGDFNMFLKRADKQLKSIKGQIQEVLDARNAFTQLLNKCNTTELPTYEKAVFSQYLLRNQLDGEDQKKNQENSLKMDKYLIFSKNPEVSDTVKSLLFLSSNNSFDNLLDLIGYQIRQIQAMQQLLNDRQSYQAHSVKCQEKLNSTQNQINKLINGKTTFKSIFSKGNKDQQLSKLQNERPILQKELEDWQRLCNSLSVVISQVQIPRFREYKKNKYYQILNQTSENELKYLQIYERFLKAIAK